MVRLWGPGPRGGLGAEVPGDTGLGGTQAWPRWGPGLTVRQVSHQVWHHVAADELPAEVIVLALAVLTLVRVPVLLEGAAGCGQRDPSAPVETPNQPIPPQKPCRDGVRHQASPPWTPVSEDMVSSAANRPFLLPCSSPTSETSWQVSAPMEVSPRSSQLCFPGAGHRTGWGFLPGDRHSPAAVAERLARARGLLQKPCFDLSPPPAPARLTLSSGGLSFIA